MSERVTYVECTVAVDHRQTLIDCTTHLVLDRGRLESCVSEETGIVQQSAVCELVRYHIFVSEGSCNKKAQKHINKQLIIFNLLCRKLMFFLQTNELIIFNFSSL